MRPVQFNSCIFLYEVRESYFVCQRMTVENGFRYLSEKSILFTYLSSTRKKYMMYPENCWKDINYFYSPRTLSKSFVKYLTEYLLCFDLMFRINALFSPWFLDYKNLHKHRQFGDVEASFIFSASTRSLHNFYRCEDSFASTGTKTKCLIIIIENPCTLPRKHITSCLIS